MKNTLELWPEVKKSQARAAFTPQGEKKRKGLQFKGRSQGQTSKGGLCHWIRRAKTCISSGREARVAWTQDASQLRKLLIGKLERISQREHGHRRHKH